MALKSCYECNKEISTKAIVCPQCGAPQNPVSGLVDKVKEKRGFFFNKVKNHLEMERIQKEMERIRKEYGDGNWIKQRPVQRKHYDNGKLKSETYYKNSGEIGYFGIKEGLQTFWHENGEKWFETYYKNGEIEGIVTIWYKNGQKAAEVYYKNGEKDGLEALWYEDGKQQYTRNNKNGTEHGIRKDWDEKGILRYEGNYIDGVEEIK